jgi:hypothetical protein
VPPASGKRHAGAAPPHPELSWHTHDPPNPASLAPSQVSLAGQSVVDAHRPHDPLKHPEVSYGQSLAVRHSTQSFVVRSQNGVSNPQLLSLMQLTH